MFGNLRDRLLLAATATLLLAASAAADIGPPVSIRLNVDPVAPRKDVPLAGRVELTSAAPGDLSGFRFEGEGWRTLELDAPDAVAVDKGTSLTLDFEIVCDRAPGLLTFVVERNGHRISRSWDLSEEGLRRELEPIPLEMKPASRPFPGVDRSTMLSPPREFQESPELTDRPRTKDGRYIRVYGRFVYLRDDGRLIGVDGGFVTVLDRHNLFGQTTLGWCMTDWEGYFDVTVWWEPTTGNSYADIYVDVETSNNTVTVESTYLEENYHFYSPTHQFVAGNEVWLGDLFPGSFSEGAILQIFNSIGKAWRFFYHYLPTYDPPLQYDVPHVDVQFPEQGDHAGTAWYNITYNEIHIGEERGWAEDTAIHEYGHHWMNFFGAIRDPQYWCNGFGDPPDCNSENASHAMWCFETPSDAINEGIPNWIADIVTRTYPDYYDYPASHLRPQETIQMCSDGQYHDPWQTEGHLGAVLHDIEDAYDPYNVEVDSAYASSGGADLMARGPSFVLLVCDINHSGWYWSPLDLLTLFKGELDHTMHGEFWKTAINCGYDMDFEPPSTAVGLHSTSHLVGEESTDPTIDFRWASCYDDLSGVAGFSVEVTTEAIGHVLPDETMDITGSNYTTDILASDTYYFSIRAVDRSGKWSPDYAWAGPYEIHEAIPADLVFDPRPGWNSTVVVRETDDSGEFHCPAPTMLLGNTAGTWWNTSWINAGEENWPTAWSIDLLLDDVVIDEWNQFSSPPGVPGYGINLGPLTVRGGRHTAAVHLDGDEAIPEPDEENNRFGRQFVWTPLWIDPGVPVQRPAPPAPTGGWDYLGGAILKYFNCDGLSFASSGNWNAVALETIDQEDDYDLRLFPHSTGAFSGFDLTADVSDWGPGWLDALLVNGRALGSAIWDVGVVVGSETPDAPRDDYRAVHVVSDFLPLNTTQQVDFAWDEKIALREFYVGSGDVGPLSVWFEGLMPFEDLWLLYFDRDFTKGGFPDYSAYAHVTAANPTARLDLDIGETGHHCLVVHRNPEANPDISMSCTLHIERTLPNPKYDFPPGWHSAIVPRPAPDGTPTSAPEPALLVGDAASTWLNTSIYNQSPTGVTDLPANIHLDGELLLAKSYPSIGPYTRLPDNHATAWTVRGGRHTLSLRIDEYDVVPELSEDDNIYGEQYVWDPATLAYAAPVVRGAPPDRTGGLADDPGLFGPLHYNCDGLRLPDEYSFHAGLAVMPGPESDYDVRLHPVSTGAKDGFETGFGLSGWPAGQSDYMLVNFNLMDYVQHDAGVYRIAGDQDYTAEAVTSSFLAYYPDTIFGPYTLGAGHVMQIYEAYLVPGSYGVLLENLGGAVDWGLTLHVPDVVYMGKDSAVEGGQAWLQGSGESEGFFVDIAEEGYYCLAVWKAGSADLDEAGLYQLHIREGATDVEPPPSLPARTQLTSVHPNPFNPKTTVSFALDRDDRVRLVVVDVRGRQVCTLLDERRPAGRHQLVWDGLDDRGRRLASGVYLVTMTTDAGGEVDRRKLTIIK